MAKLFTIEWTPSGAAVQQVVKYRPRGVAAWSTSIGLTPTNPQTNVADTVTLTSYDFNNVYQFQIVTICTGGDSFTDIYEAIIMDNEGLTITPGTGVVNISSNPIPGITTIDYRLVNSSAVVIDQASETGLAPQHQFTGITTGTGYRIHSRYNATVNSGTVSSTDSDQENAWYISSPFNVA